MRHISSEELEELINEDLSDVQYSEAYFDTYLEIGLISKGNNEPGAARLSMTGR